MHSKPCVPGHPVSPDKLNHDKTMTNNPVFQYKITECGRPLDLKQSKRNKAAHENGYLHHLPDYYSLASTLAWPFSSPKNQDDNAKVQPGGCVYSVSCGMGEWE
jgi:hypothetical protein